MSIRISESTSICGKSLKGFRRVTPRIHASAELAAKWDDAHAVPKRRVVLAFNKVARTIGLNSQAIELMNKLFSFSLEQDWQPGSRPIVWPDNQRLLKQLSYSIASLKRNLRVLSEKGLISFRDSPNGRRYGKRIDGAIVLGSTFGIDLSPSGVRLAELEQIAEAEERDNEEIRQLSRRWTRERRMLAGIIETARSYDVDGPWSECAAEMERLCELRRGQCSASLLCDLCDALSDIHERVRTAYSAASEQFTRTSSAETVADNDAEGLKVSPMGFNSEPHIQNTKQKSPQSLYNQRRSAFAEQNPSPKAGYASSNRASRKPVATGSHVQPHSSSSQEVPELDVLLDACPALADWATSRLRDWRDLIDLTDRIRPVIGISPNAWNDARVQMGRNLAAAALAVIYQKYTMNEIREPGGYLRAMTDRHRAGQLKLDLSIKSLKMIASGIVAPSAQTSLFLS